MNAEPSQSSRGIDPSSVDESRSPSERTAPADRTGLQGLSCMSAQSALVVAPRRSRTVFATLMNSGVSIVAL